MSREEFLARQFGESAGFIGSLCVAWWGLSRGLAEPDPIDLTAFFLFFPLLAAIPSVLSPRAFRWTLLLAGLALLTYRIGSLFQGSQPLAREVAVAIGVLGTGLFVTPRTQRLLALARWALALGIIALYATTPLQDLRGLAGAGLLILSPVLLPSAVLCVWKSRRLFESDGQDWAYGVQIPGAPHPDEIPHNTPAGVS